MVNFVKAAATAKRLVEANGRSVTLFRSNRTPANASQPWRGVSGSPTAPEGGISADVTMAFVPATGGGFGKMIKDLGGQISVAFDQVGLLATDSLPTGVSASDVEGMDSIRDGSGIWKIVTRGHLRPADRSLLFVLGLKR